MIKSIFKILFLIKYKRIISCICVILAISLASSQSIYASFEEEVKDHASNNKEVNLSTSLSKFSEIAAESYCKFVTGFKEKANLSKREMVTAIQEWSEKAELPIIALKHHSLFFYHNLPILPSSSTPDLNKEALKDTNFFTRFYNDKIELLKKKSSRCKEIVVP